MGAPTPSNQRPSGRHHVDAGKIEALEVGDVIRKDPVDGSLPAATHMQRVIDRPAGKAQPGDLAEDLQVVSSTMTSIVESRPRMLSSTSARASSGSTRLGSGNAVRVA